MAYNLSPLSILVVEDDQSMRWLIRDLLNTIGVGNIQTANDGTQAYSALRHFHADIVICDWVMSPMTGLEFLHRIRNNKDSPNPFLPVLMLTAYSQLTKVEECRDTGVTGFLSKPVIPKTLYARIANLIEDQRDFVRSETYFGPDRRRMDRPYVGTDRRSSGTVVDLDDD